MTPGFWRGRKVFLTGHTGFKGSWLSLWLQQLGAQVTGYALQPPTQPSLFELAGVASGMRSILGDVRDGAHLAAAMKDAQPEVVIHMAAQPLVRHSYAEPVETYATNVMGTVHLLEAVRQTASVRSVVNVTTDKCYENREWVWAYREDEPMGGHDPYSSSKGCAELVTAAYRSSFFPAALHERHRVALASARAGNVIGGGDWAKDRLIPDILAAFGKGEPVVIRNPSATRPWQHVLEPLRGYLVLAERLYTDGTAYAEGWNFGPWSEDARPVEWITRELAERWGAGARWEVSAGEHPHEANYLKLDISKAGARLQWRPVLRLAEALDLIVQWDRARSSGADLHSLTLTQISDYQSRALAPI
ncbi:CDP-glucose 4,6-dehydratase [Ramlibacter ginsenosidimutans]|uniref:CDP-glucose 4,6-dehydratase n=1 Tax=Ramlibacter ginsenosidimutans TaxID=502333 RepID=A0A934WJF3_9BURK|nr:CDP-glucose 4,6-dehydratase [Ramlibacter ginsenosidimutans]MBK6004594.1 CDP-glucose 4,6-dehydratase [Ramlibacter ginsenosidimutans]